MSTAVKRRRESAAYLASFAGPAAEILVDTTNWRVVVQDGSTPGGFPAAKLADLAQYAPLASPALTGTPTAPTASSGTNSGQIATTAFVASGFVSFSYAAASYAPLASPAFGGIPTAPTAAPGTNSSQLATTSFVAASFVTYSYAGATYATNASPTFSGTPTAPTPALGDNSTKLATTAFVGTALGAAFARTQVSDAAYTVLTTDRRVAVTALTAARVLTLPAASGFPPGATLTIVDESGACSATNTITLVRVGSDTINGAAGAVIASPYGYVEIESNGSNKWTTVSAPAPVQSVAGRTGIVTLSVSDVSGAAPLASPAFTGTPTAPNAAAGTNTTQVATTSFVAASFVSFTYASATYAPLANAALTGTPTAPTQAQNDNSTRVATTAYADRAASANFARTQVNDSAYTALPTDRTIAVVALSAARILTLPASSAHPAGATLTVVDESGACSVTNTITIARAGSDTINGAASAVLTLPYGYLALESNGSNKWTIVDQIATAGTLPLATVAQGAAGSTVQFGTLEQLVTLSGASTTSTIQIPNRAIVFAVSARTVAAVTGAPSYGVGVAGNATQFGGSLGTSAGSSNSGVIGPTAFYSPTNVVITATSGSFTGGSVRIAIQYILCNVPTS